MDLLPLPLLAWILLVVQNVGAGPLEYRRVTREVYPEIEVSSSEKEGTNQAQVCIVGDVVYGVGESVPADQFCLKCICQPPGVQCEAVKCAKKQGCKAIHGPNKCCPDYQCECRHEGLSYANGERLPTPEGGECKVCFCRGGEVQCAEVSCYIRSDCEGKTVPGQCCPKYDNCPPIDRPDDLNREQLELLPLQNYTTADNVEGNNNNNNNDDDHNDKVVMEKPTITIQEIIPQVKEIAIQSSPSPNEKTETSNNDLAGASSTDAEAESSEISEVFQDAPPVLRIGDKLLFLKQSDGGGEELISEKGASTPSTVITIIGAEGLQRGFEDNSAESALFNTTTNHLDDEEPKTSESTHILSLLKPKQKPSTTTENVIVDLTALTTVPEVKNTTTNDSTSALNVTESSEENPHYPAIPDAMSPDETTFTKLPEVVTRILPDILEIRDNKTITENGTHGEWLKNENSGGSLMVNVRAILPESILNQTVFGDFDNDTMESLENTTDSGEATTQTLMMSQLFNQSEENASVLSSFDSSSESFDMMLKQPESSSLKLEDVEMISITSSTMSPTVKDVELISPKLIAKRESSQAEEADEVFKQLEMELGGEATERILTESQEKLESEQIFRELLEETSTPKSTKKLTKEEEGLQRISDAIAKLALNGGGKSSSGLDTSILGAIGNFFTSQYRLYNKK